jgi:adenylate cyclase
MNATPLVQRLAAILAADAAGYSRLMALDDQATVAALDAARQVFRAQIESHQGRVIDMAGDSILAVFPTASGAVSAALSVQQELDAASEQVDEDRRMRFRIGVHLGDVIEKPDGSVYGDGVNIAARLEGLAVQGGITISDAVRGAVRGKVPASFADQGEQVVKNIPEPVHAFGVMLLVGGATAAAATAPPAPARRAPGKPSLAVLPFSNLSADTDQEYFADGITEDIITDVSKVSGLFVIARNSSFALGKQNLDVQEVGRKLGVRHVLEGSVRKVGMKVRINAQLIEVESGFHVWAERYDRGLEDIFLVQDELTRRIVEALKVNLTGIEEAGRQDRSKVDARAYDCYIRGRALLLQFTAEATREACSLFERAIELDPGMAQAYGYLVFAHGAEFLNRWNDAPPDTRERMHQLALRAIEANELEPTGHLALATSLLWQRRLADAERAARRALELAPNSAEAHGGLGNAMHFSGRFEQAIAQFEQAIKLDPRFDMWIQFCGRSQLALERYDDAEKSFKRRLMYLPKSDVTRAYLASLYGSTGRLDEARAVWREMLEINPDFSMQHLIRLMPYADPAPLDRLVAGLRNAGLVP